MLLNIIFAALFFQSPSSLDQMVTEYLRTELYEYNRFEYEIVSVPETMLEQANGIRINNDRQFRLSRQFGYIPIVIMSDSYGETNSLITVELKLYDDVVRALRDIESGETVSPGDFEYIEQDITVIRGYPITDLYSISGQQAMKNIKAGTIVTENMVRPKLLINPGDVLNAYLQHGSIMISFRAEARNGGFKGDIIRIVNNEKKVFRAKIEDAGTVQVLK